MIMQMLMNSFLVPPLPNSYDYVDNPIDGTNALPPALAPLASSLYTNTTPGKITLEAESHYDLGQ